MQKSLAQKTEAINIIVLNNTLIRLNKILNIFYNINIFNYYNSCFTNTEIKNFCPFNSNEIESNKILPIKLIKSNQELNLI